MIRLSHVSKVFNAGPAHGIAALSDISLDINGEGTVVFRGPSGSGKTTLLSLLGCMSRPTAGRIWIHETEVSTLSERFLSDLRRHYFGFVFQDFQLLRGLSVLTNVMLPLYPLGTSRRQMHRSALGLLADLEIEAKARLPVECLSSGEQQRVALARALINKPDFLVADEPTAHLDTASVGRFMDVVERLKRKGATILIASHDPRVYESPVANRIVTLRDGHLQPPEDTP